jgi:hypothetical protein
MKFHSANIHPSRVGKKFITFAIHVRGRGGFFKIAFNNFCTDMPFIVGRVIN